MGRQVWSGPADYRRGSMGDQLTYNLADQWEAVSDRVADREAVVCGRRRLTYAQLEERGQPSGEPPDVRRRRSGRLRRVLPAQRHRVPRDAAGLLQDPGRPGQHQLPLRHRRAPAPARRLGLGGAGVQRGVPAEGGRGRSGRPGAAPDARRRAGCRVVAADRHRCARTARLRADARRGVARAPGRGRPRRRRHLRALHRRHHRPAQGRRVAHGRRVLRLHRRRRPDAPVGAGLLTRGEPRAHHRLRLRVLRAGAAHARRRPVGLDDVAALRRQGRAARRAPSTPSRSGAPSTRRRSR